MKELYKNDMAVFGKNLCGPEILPHGEKTLIAKYPRTSDDGQAVDVYCTALPARFYTIKAIADKNSVGEDNKPFILQTGSGCEKLTADIAEAISGGMLGIDKEG